MRYLKDVFTLIWGLVNAKGIVSDEITIKDIEKYIKSIFRVKQKIKIDIKIISELLDLFKENKNFFKIKNFLLY
jgi:hypothetical protein